MPSDHELNRLLDEALHSYAAEPDAHLENRILATVREEARQATNYGGARWRRWGLAGVACAILIGIAVYLGHPRRHLGEFVHIPQQTRPSSQPSNQAQTSDIASATSARPSNRLLPQLHQPPRKEKALTRAPAQPPKLDVFPTPDPPTAEERALVAYSKNPTGNQQQKPSVVHAEDLEVEPIRIAEIHVEPLPPVIEGEHH